MADKKQLLIGFTEPVLAKSFPGELGLAGRALKAITNRDISYYQNGLKLFSVRSYDEAFRFFEQGANLNHAPSQHALGCMYQKGLGTQQSSKQAFYWFNKAADQGCAGGDFSLGFMYAYGKFVESSSEKAYIYIKRAAVKGYREAQKFLADATNPIGNELFNPNPEESFFWENKAAQQGDQWAQWSLFFYYKNGKNVTKSNDLALYWLHEAAKEIPVNPEDEMAFLYDLVNSDLISIAFANKYTGKGCLFAQQKLGELYLKGEIVSQSYEKAVYWYRKSSDQDNDLAQTKLGELYLKGLGVDKNINVAIELFKKAANQGWPPAINHLKELGITL